MIALWLAVGVAYAGGRWFAENARMDFVRFSGELFIYYVLIALGGGVLTGFTILILLVNLSWPAWLYAGFLRGSQPFTALERWQMAYLPVYSAWAAFVVIVFLPLFAYA
jgi:hypothetical protein